MQCPRRPLNHRIRPRQLRQHHDCPHRLRLRPSRLHLGLDLVAIGMRLSQARATNISKNDAKGSDSEFSWWGIASQIASGFRCSAGKIIQARCIFAYGATGPIHGPSPEWIVPDIAVCVAPKHGATTIDEI